MVYNIINQPKKTIEIGNQILKFDFYNYYGNYYYIQALNKLKNYKFSYSLIIKMLKLYPTSILYLNSLTNWYYLNNNINKVKEYSNIILSLDPNNIQAKNYLK